MKTVDLNILGAAADNWNEAGVIVPVVGIIGVASVFIIGFLTDAIRKVAQTRSREQTKRELAAYVAEGTMTPENAERILKADQKSARCGAGDSEKHAT